MKDKINDFQEELDNLKKINPDKRRAAFLTYCKKNIELEKNGKLNIEESSNRICGACSLYFKEIMPEFEEVMDIACDLEIPKNLRDRSEKDWNKLKNLISK